MSKTRYFLWLCLTTPDNLSVLSICSVACFIRESMSNAREGCDDNLHRRGGEGAALREGGCSFNISTMQFAFITIISGR